MTHRVKKPQTQPSLVWCSWPPQRSQSCRQHLTVGISLKGDLKTSQNQVRMAPGSCGGGVWSQAVLPSPGNCPWSAESRAPTARSCCKQLPAPWTAAQAASGTVQTLETSALLPQSFNCVWELADRVQLWLCPVGSWPHPEQPFPRSWDPNELQPGMGTVLGVSQASCCSFAVAGAAQPLLARGGSRDPVERSSSSPTGDPCRAGQRQRLLWAEHFHLAPVTSSTLIKKALS